MCQERNKLSEQILYCLSELSKICPAISVQSIRAKTQAANSTLFNHLHQIKAQKLDQPIGPQITSDSWPENLKTAVTIPENLLLSDSEKSFLSMGLNFVPALAKKMILTSRTKILSKHFRFESLNGIPQRASSHTLVFFIRKSRDDINKLKFNRNTKFSDLSSEEWSALKSPNSQITSDSWPENIKTVVTITENLLLSDSEKSVLSKGLNFVPISKKPDKLSVKQDVEKFLRRVQLKAFFHDKKDDSNISNEDTFETLQVRKSKCIPQKG